MIVSIFEQNGTAVGFKQYTNNRLIVEYYKAPADSTNEIDKHTYAIGKPGLEAHELFGVLVPYIRVSGPNGKKLWCYNFILNMSPLIWGGVYIEDIYILAVIPGDLKDYVPSLNLVNVYDCVTGRFLAINKGEIEFFESFLEYREKVRKGEIVDEH